MGYMHIDNLYKDQTVLMFRRGYALEKIHGTSAHIHYTSEGLLHFFSGGESHDRFISLWGSVDNPVHYDYSALLNGLQSVGNEVIVYGEAYGGKQQGMSDTYGKQLRFVAFDVKIHDMWLSVPQAADFVQELGLEFVDYVEGPMELEFLDAERDRPSVQAVRNGILEPKEREGIIIRPPMEMHTNSGKRIIAKHKRDSFRETSKARKVVDPTQLEVLSEANAVAEEWVTEMRLTHVLDKLSNPGIERTRDVIFAMHEDVKREGEGEIVWSKEVEKAVGKKTSEMFKARLQGKLHENL